MGTTVNLPVSTLGRPEFVSDIEVSGINKTLNLPTQGGMLPNDLFLRSLLLEVEFRCTNAGTNNPTGRQADAPFSIIESVQVEGYHRPRAQRELFVNLRGADLYNLCRIYQGLNPYSTHQSGDLSLTASATNDVRFILPVPFMPLNFPPSRQLRYALDSPNYDNLKLTIQFADDKSLFTFGTYGAGAFSQFGSASGNPRIRVSRVAVMSPGRFSGFVPGRIWRYSQEVTTGDIVSGGTAKRLFNLPRGYKLRALLLKTGTKSAAVTTGNNVYSALSDSVLTNLKIMRGINRPLRYYTDQIVPKEEIAAQYGVQPNVGYTMIDFAPRGTDQEVLDTASLVSGPTGDVDSYIETDIAAGSNQGAVMIIEEMRGEPVSIANVRVK